MRERPQALIESAVRRYGADEVVDWAAGLLAGADPDDAGPDDAGLDGAGKNGVRDIRLLGGSPGWDAYWFRVWGARALLYVWDTTAAPAVVSGLSDDHWRVREMCAKVCRLRDLPEAADELVKLMADGTERVRIAAAKAIGDTCEADAAGPLLAGEFGSLREAAAVAQALDRMEQRLDRRLR